VKRIAFAVAIFGGVVILGGVLTALATIGHSGEDLVRAFGLVLISFGGICIAIPFYLLGLSLRRQYGRTDAPVAKRNLSPCAVCSNPTATLWCTTHLMRICPVCLSRHDEPSRCLYRTLGRTSGSAKGAAGPASTRA
jgi:hypothetical protein